MHTLFLILWVSVLAPLISASEFDEFPQKKTDGQVKIEIDPKCLKPIYNVYASGDLQAFTSCHSISGSIYINDFDSKSIDLGQISEIKGDLSISNATSVQRIQGLELESIGGTFHFETLTSLTNLAFPKLHSVETLKWHVLPILTSVNFKTGIKNIKSVILSDTALTGFGGFDVDKLRDLKIINNRYLERLESSVSEISGELSISANAENLHVDLQNLTRVKSLTVKDAKSINLDSLQTVQENTEFINNQFSTLNVPNLKFIGYTLSIIDNEELELLDFGFLTEVGGGLMIIDNQKISNVDFFSSLKSVGGAIELQGDIASTKFRELKIIKGSALLNSSSNELDCKEWVSSEVSKAVRGGKIECVAGDKPKEVLHVDERGKTTKEGKGGANIGGNIFKQKDSGVCSLKVSFFSVICGWLLAITQNWF